MSFKCKVWTHGFRLKEFLGCFQRGRSAVSPTHHALLSLRQSNLSFSPLFYCSPMIQPSLQTLCFPLLSPSFYWLTPFLSILLSSISSFIHPPCHPSYSFLCPFSKPHPDSKHLTSPPRFLSALSSLTNFVCSLTFLPSVLSRLCSTHPWRKRRRGISTRLHFFQTWELCPCFIQSVLWACWH